LRISLYKSHKDNRPTSDDVTWDDLSESLTKHVLTDCAPCSGKDCAHKYGPAWSPVLMDGTRKSDHVREVSAVVFDLDHLTADTLAGVIDRVEGAALAYVVHSTHSHQPADDCAVRLVLRPNRPITPAEFPQLHAAVKHQLQIPADEAAKDLARLYFLPTAPAGGPETIAHSEPGGDLDVDAFLSITVPAAPHRSFLARAQELAEYAPPVPLDASEAYDLDGLRKKLRGKDGLKHILKGEPLATTGSRDNTLNHLCSTLAFAVPAATPIPVLLELIRPSVALCAEPEGTDHWLEEARDMLERAFTRRAEREAAELADREMGMRALRRDSAQAAQYTSQEKEADTDPSEQYPAELLSIWFRQQGVETVDEFRKRWIIQRGESFYVFVGGRYSRPVMRGELDVSLPRDLSRAPVALERQTGTNGDSSRRATTQEILGDYCSVARGVRASLSLQRSFYDPGTQTFHEAVCPLIPIEPTFHQEIADWLEFLGGNNVKGLLDFVASVSRLERQSGALILQGEKGTGKTLLANGLARLWGAQAPSRLDVALSSFNDTIIGCPLLFADEKLPDRPGITAELRDLLGSPARTLSRKFMPSAVLEGSVRLIIASNNENIFSNAEDLSVADMAAVAARFIYITPSPGAAQYLIKLGGPPVVNQWIHRNMIAEHAMWLRDNHAVDETSRFLAEGRQTEFHDALTTSGSLSGGVCEFLCSYLTDKTTEREDVGGAILAGESELLVSTKAMLSPRAWEQRAPSVRPPSASRVGSALKGLSSGSIKFKLPNGEQRDFHRVKVALVVAWAERNLYSDTGQIIARLSKANPTVAKGLGIEGVSRG
jgi:hypothetical protein